MSEIAGIILVVAFMALTVWLTLVWIKHDQRKLNERAKRLEKEMKKINDQIDKIFP